MAKRGRRPINLTGQRFYRYLVIAPVEPQKPGNATLWLCRCDCGREVPVRGSNLRSGNSKSCGHCGRVYTRPTEQEEAAVRADTKRAAPTDPRPHRIAR